MKQEIDNDAMWAAFRKELALQGELQVVAAIDNALNNLGFTIKETSTIIPISLKQGEQRAKYHDICDKCVRQPICQSDCFLQQGEQKPADTYCQKHCKGYQETGRCFADGDCQAKRDNDKKLQQEAKETLSDNSAWSEEDKTILKAIILNLEECSKTCAIPSKEYVLKCIIWLKSLKDRVQPQPRIKWSEEDLMPREEIINLLQKYGMDNEVAWLKSLKPKKHWKPSDEQMDVLLSEVKGWTKGCPKQIVLESLYNDLKKLRKE